MSGMRSNNASSQIPGQGAPVASAQRNAAHETLKRAQPGSRLPGQVWVNSWYL
eukprot:CAMPEP_0204274050 /NCGR_PEP_ID=MMETSP0468-20130131/24924_1 /ASSEMBLY_ACC=CAM_ASM_000383 /TAXON_ID=2969 /ORGANISM="Oxyrrhis marina" /LENGTH=52 /DNA_ID=CAMNT_0051250197 /DNA_START=22 /DNA_END=177 /DNA_ORIENTATION=-